ncbi:MAG: alpha/beta fold hydrolase [Acidimicrobiales bacterium]
MTAADVIDRLEVGATRIVVHRTGGERTVGYLHGMVGTPPGAPFLSAAAEAGLAVTAPCLPGFSGSSPSTETRTIHDWVFHLSAIVDATGLTGRPLVASSVGAMVAVELAALRPEAFSHLVLLAPLGLWDAADPIADPYATTLSVQRRLLTADPTVTGIFFDDPPGMEGDELVEYGVARYQTRTSAASLVWPLPDHGLADRIHRVTTPVTLVWGSDDRLAPVSYLDRWAAALPDVVGRHTIDGAGHLVDWDHPDEVAAIVAAAV